MDHWKSLIEMKSAKCKSLLPLIRQLEWCQTKYRKEVAQECIETMLGHGLTPWRAFGEPWDTHLQFFKHLYLFVHPHCGPYVRSRKAVSDLYNTLL